MENPTLKRDVTTSVSRVSVRGAASAGFLLALVFDPEVGGDMFLQNVGLSVNYMTLQPRRMYCL
jgi:hypothetical protein